MSTLKLSEIVSGSSANSNTPDISSLINQPNGVLGLNSSGKPTPNSLGSGTPSTSTFLRGDGYWNTIPNTTITFDDISSFLGTTAESISVGNHTHDSKYIKLSDKGVENGVAGLDNTGKVPLSQLPDTGLTIQEYSSYHDFPSVGQANTIYLALDTNISYQWSGSTYAQVSGDSSGTATVPYNYYTVTEDTTLSNLDVVNVETAALILTLPSEPVNGFEISIIVGDGIDDTTVNPNGSTINGVSDNLVISTPNSSTYLLYIDGWKVIDKTQVVRIGSQDINKFINNTNYFPDGTDYIGVESTIYDKEAWEEKWQIDSNILARQVTIFNNEDNFVSTWVEGTSAIDKIVSYEPSSQMPTVQYRKNNKITMCEILGIDWRLYETFSDFISVGSNLRSAVQNQNVLNLIRESDSNWEDFTNSTALPITSVAQMTSANSPSGVVTASSTYEDFYPWRVFDRNNTSFWASLTDSDEWIAYEFPPDVNFFLHTFTIRQRDSDNAPKEIIIQRSTDGTDWIDHENIQLPGGPTYDERTYQIVKANTAAKHWRVYITNNYGGSRIGIYEIQFTGWNIA